MVHGKNRIPYRIDRRLTGLAGPDYDATISFGLPIEPEDSQYGKSRIGSQDVSAASPQVVSARERSRIAALCCSAAVLRRRLAAFPGTHSGNPPPLFNQDW